SQTAAEVEAVVAAQLRKNSIATKVDFSTIRSEFSEKMINYSNADVEAVLLSANELAARDPGANAMVEGSHFIAAMEDYFPSRDTELLAVFESSSRRMLPQKYATMTPEELDARLRFLRAAVANRR
ncbi:MAG: hypothetical protein ACLPV8_22560, partial [Steroidobacteraceae bacterium]